MSCGVVLRAMSLPCSWRRPRWRVARRVTELLGYLGAAGVVSGTQFAKGFARVAVTLKDLALDTPDAQEIFERLVADARGKGLLPAGLSAWASFRVGGDVSRRSPASPEESRSSPGGSLPAGGGVGGLDARHRGSDDDAGAPRARGGRGGGHLMRLDSAPDLIALARSLKTVGLEKSAPFPEQKASPSPLANANGADSRSPVKGPTQGPGPGPGPAEREKSRLSPSRAQARASSSRGETEKTEKKLSSLAQGVLSAVPARVSKSNQVDANWSGLRAPRAGRRDRGASGSAFSGSGSAPMS